MPRPPHLGEAVQHAPAGSPKGGQFVSQGGGGGSSTGGEKKKADHPPPSVDYQVGVAEKAKELFGRDVPPHEMAAMAGALPGAKVTVRDEGSHLDVRVEHESYGAFRQFFRQGPDVVCLNHTIRVKETGKGLGTKIFAGQVDALSKAGVKEIRAHCKRDDERGWNGYSTWPKLGYDGPIPEKVRGNWLDHLRGRGLPRAYRKAQTVGELLELPGGREWWEKHGDTADMTFNLAEGSRSRQVLNAYLERRKGKSHAG